MQLISLSPDSSDVSLSSRALVRSSNSAIPAESSAMAPRASPLALELAPTLQAPSGHQTHFIVTGSLRVRAAIWPKALAAGQTPTR